MSLLSPILQAGGMHASGEQKGLEGEATLQTLLLTGWVSYHSARTRPYQTGPTGLLTRFCDQLRASQCRDFFFFFEHDKHLIMVFNFVCCLLGLTGNEEGKSISCCFIKHLQYLPRPQNASGETRQNKPHEAIAKQMSVPSARPTHGRTEDTAAVKAGDFTGCAWCRRRSVLPWV